MNADSSQIGLPAMEEHALVRDGIAGLVGVQPDMVVSRQPNDPILVCGGCQRKWFSCISKLAIVPR